MGKLRSYLTQVQDFIADPISRSMVLNDLYQEALEVLFNDDKEPPKEAIVLRVFPRNQTTSDLKDGDEQFQSAVLRIDKIHDSIPDPLRVLRRFSNGQLNNCIQMHGVCFSKEPITSVDGNELPSSLVKVGDVVSIEYINGVPRFGTTKRHETKYTQLESISEKPEDQNKLLNGDELLDLFNNREIASLEELVDKGGVEISGDSLRAASNNPILTGQTITNGKLPREALYVFPDMRDSKGRPVAMLLEIADEFQALLDDFEEHFGYPLIINDTYRSYERQVSVKAIYGSKAATPGTSKHGWGLAFDCETTGKGDGIKGFGGEIYAWLQKNAPKRGFWNPSWAQQTGKNPEAWHWEAVRASRYISIFGAVDSEQAE